MDFRLYEQTHVMENSLEYQVFVEAIQNASKFNQRICHLVEKSS